jgi:hypothetical protein
MSTDTPRRAELGITVKASLNGFPIELGFTGSIDSLPALVKRLVELGAEPQSNTASNGITFAQQHRKPAKRVQPAYAGDGTPTCPTHGTALREGRWGLFCPTKDATNGEYCKLKFSE